MAAKAAHADSAALLGSLEQLHTLVQAFPALTNDPSDLRRVTDLVRDLLGVDVVSVLDTSTDPPRVVTASPPELAGLARAVGGLAWPAIAASGSGMEVHCPDLATGPDTRGAEAARELSLRSVAAFPLIARGRSLGALSLYDRSVRNWAKGELALGRLATGLIALHLDNAATVHRQRVLTGQLQTALDSRVVIEQAKGVLAASAGISVEQAFAQMRDQARSANAKLSDVASGVVAGGVFPVA